MASAIFSALEYTEARKAKTATRAPQAATPPRRQHRVVASTASVVHNPERSLIRILDVGLRTVATGRRLSAPVAALVFVFDDLRVARHPLLGRGGASRREGLRVGRIWLREYAVDRVRPAVVVPDDLIRDMRHRFNSQ